mmetsp:Transcript_2891/g.10538  ORF Transcript_2891/g.10538 Transcript_2891/m.10538 type:complete len:191 (-) Transcript_2891:3618-4190(-)
MLFARFSLDFLVIGARFNQGRDTSTHGGQGSLQRGRLLSGAMQNARTLRLHKTFTGSQPSQVRGRRAAPVMRHVRAEASSEDEEGSATAQRAKPAVGEDPVRVMKATKNFMEGVEEGLTPEEVVAKELGLESLADMTESQRDGVFREDYGQAAEQRRPPRGAQARGRRAHQSREEALRAVAVPQGDCVLR